VLNRMQLKNFKSIRDLDFPIKPLTVLAGLNGSGKSTVLQGLALVKQTVDQMPERWTLALRGALVRLGRSEDVHFESALSEELELSVSMGGAPVRFISAALPNADTLDLRVDGDWAALKESLSRGFQFIQADRLTPASQYEQASTPDQARGWLGCRGEFTVDFLQRNEDLHVPAARHCRGGKDGVDVQLLRQVAPTPSLRDQTSGWLQLLSPGVTLRAISIDLADVASLRFQYTNTRLDSAGRQHRPSNVGFGLTYCLPIVVSCLAAESGALLLLENPEAHLHPRGQADPASIPRTPVYAAMRRRSSATGVR
jgi:predicted ATPase